MAFSFAGASNAASSSSFSFAAAAPAASSSSSFSFGGATTPASLFSASSSAFAQQQSTPSIFGAASSSAFGTIGTSTPAFGSTGGSLFGGSSAGAFGASTASIFGAASTPSLFAASISSQPGALTAFSAPAFGSTFVSSTFGQAPPPQQQQQISSALCGKEGKPLTHLTKWDDISPQGQAYLLELEKVISQYRDDCQQLDDNGRLWGDQGRTLKQEMAADEQALKQALTGLEAALKGDLQTIAVFREKALALLHDTEQVVRTFQRTHRWRAAGKVLPGQALPPGIREHLNGPVILPSVHLRRATTAFQEALKQYQALVSELESLLPQQLEQKRGNGGPSPIATLPVVLHNMHDFFNHVAARLEKLHDGIAAAKDAFLDRRREAGDMSDPFAEAERIAQLRKQAARAKATVIPPSQGASATQATSSAPATCAPSAVPAQGAGGGLFGSMVTPSLFGTSATPAATSTAAVSGSSNLFGASTPAWGAAAAISTTPTSTTNSNRRGRSRR